MSSRVPETDLRNLWQNMETESATVSLEQMRLKAQRFMKKNRHDLIARSAFAVVAAAFCGIVIFSVRAASIAAVAGLVMAMLLADTVRRLYIYYRAGEPWSSCLEFYRSELERQRQVAIQPAWQLAAALLIIAWLSRRSVMRGPDSLRIMLPVVLIAAAGLIVLMVIRKLGTRRIQTEIDALNKFEEENRSGGDDGVTYKGSED